MRLIRRLENVSAGRSAWACCLAAATITTSEAPTILSLLQRLAQYSATLPTARYRRGRSLDLMEWIFANTRFTGIATALLAAPTTSWARGHELTYGDCSLSS